MTDPGRSANSSRGSYGQKAEFGTVVKQKAPGTRRTYRPWSSASVALLYERDGLFKRLKSDIRLVFRHHQRRREANRARAAAQHQDSAFERHLHNAVAFGGSVRLGLLVLDDLDPDHQSATAHIANDA